MKQKVLSTGGLVIGLLIASPASAFEFSGTDVSLQYFNWWTSALNPQKAIGSANFGFELGSNLYGQFGATSAAVLGTGGGLDFGSMELHLGIHATDNIDFGVFAGVDHYLFGGAPFDYHVGAEVGFSLGAFEAEIYGGRYFEANDPAVEIFAGGAVSYAVSDAFELSAGLFYNAEPYTVWEEYYLDFAARYNVNENWFVEGIYSWQPQFAEHGVGVRIGFETDGGTRFTNHDFTSLANSFY
ncbi:hypothetical protein [Sinisalibacter aestuarii]|uniref:Outer membrane protein beta-barrel domain-containing protein n=1 Tax=Sinisalibacter aestuarii TaxID=2949426 RepID=A0ABQ5LU45_9RHOB|nr:hypothetical protein [Sinisalibacter aestuarii]GKY88143.1 hypothetical protein STA1M1_20120 [Sinisalibacter aestuarii]